MTGDTPLPSVSHPQDLPLQGQNQNPDIDPSNPGFEFQTPTKALLTPDQLEFFQNQSRTHADVLDFVCALNESVVGMPLEAECHISEVTASLLAILDRIEALAKETPPVDNKASRFGNPAFRTFYDKVATNAHELHTTIPGLPAAAIEEVSTYFKESWGNRTRIDYGSGMELNFFCWLLCLTRLQLLHPADHSALVLRVFWRYIGVMRVLQSTYWLEPAGSHGVWGLDDYHFLPFLWGSAQLRGHKHLRPKSIHSPEILSSFSSSYMYFSCIAFINSVKTASLRWHSPMLDDISAVKTWDKVNAGMLKMYKAEVLGKLPVVQHFLFGSLLKWDGPPPAHAHGPGCANGHGHGHSHAERKLPPGVQIHPSRLTKDGEDGDMGGAGQREVGWGDCCGIPVPSVFGAAAAQGDGREAGRRLEGVGIRPVPFD